MVNNLEVVFFGSMMEFRKYKKILFKRGTDLSKCPTTAWKLFSYIAKNLQSLKSYLIHLNVQFGN